MSSRWVAGRPNESERLALDVLGAFAQEDLELAKSIARSSWFWNGIDAKADFLRLVLGLPDSIHDPTSDVCKGLSDTLHDTLANLAESSGHYIYAVASRPWVADGLSREEAAFLIAVSRVPDTSPDLFHDLLARRFVRAHSVALPLAGDVNFWFFSNERFSERVNELRSFERYARVAENFLGVPLPTSDVIVLVITRSPPYHTLQYHKKYLGSRIQVTRVARDHSPSGSEHVVKYFLQGKSLPNWLSDSIHDFTFDLVLDSRQIGVTSRTGNEAAGEVRRCREQYGLENIRHLRYIQRENREEWRALRPYGCRSSMGRHLLHRAYDTIGLDAMSAGA